LLLAGIAVLPSCSVTQVHVFSHDLPEAEVFRVAALLQRRGSETSINTLPVPEGIDGPTLLYSPAHERAAQIEKLGNLLIDSGYDVILEPVSRGNHFYTASNVGLYLHGHRATTGQGKSLEGREFNGDCESVDAYLDFSASRFSIEFIAWDDASQEEKVSTVEGVWRRRADTVILAMGTQQVEMEVIPVKNRT